MEEKKRPRRGTAKGSSGGKGSENTELPLAVNLKRQLSIQKALYEIADAASARMDMRSFYKRLHEIVEKLMYAQNFFVSLYDPATQMLSAPYVADETEDTPPLPVKIDPSHKSLRAYVLRTGRTLHLSKEEVEKGKFREDLFYRINVILLDIPPLRDRRDGIHPVRKHIPWQYLLCISAFRLFLYPKYTDTPLLQTL